MNNTLQSTLQSTFQYMCVGCKRLFKTVELRINHDCRKFYDSNSAAPMFSQGWNKTKTTQFLH